MFISIQMRERAQFNLWLAFWDREFMAQERGVFARQGTALWGPPRALVMCIVCAGAQMNASHPRRGALFCALPFEFHTKCASSWSMSARVRTEF